MMNRNAPVTQDQLRRELNKLRAEYDRKIDREVDERVRRHVKQIEENLLNQLLDLLEFNQENCIIVIYQMCLEILKASSKPTE